MLRTAAFPWGPPGLNLGGVAEGVRAGGLRSTRVNTGGWRAQNRKWPRRSHTSTMWPECLLHARTMPVSGKKERNDAWCDQTRSVSTS